ncbi:MAG: phosphate ABC transporter substrate-binding protein [Candidatus Hydrogenedentota bacterium]
MNAREMCKPLLFLVLGTFTALTMSCGSSPGGVSESDQSIMIKGSDTMLHLVTAWADAYMSQHPEVSISVTGGGSGTGIAALLNGTTDLCASSREVKEEEIKLAQQKGLNLNVVPVARDAITVIVNPQNPVSELTVEQLKKIYTGAYKTWDQVGGPAEPIVVLSRESSSGTYVFFLEHVLNKEDYTKDSLLLPATSAMIQSVTDSPNAIGYVGLGYAEEAADKVKMLSVKRDSSSPAVAPSTETVLSGEYSLARPLNLASSGDSTGAVKTFIDFCLGPEGQALVAETGYVSVQ